MAKHIDWDYAEIAHKAQRAGYRMPTLGNDPEGFNCYMRDLRAAMDEVSLVFEQHASTDQ